MRHSISRDSPQVVVRWYVHGDYRRPCTLSNFDTPCRGMHGLWCPCRRAGDHTFPHGWRSTGMQKFLTRGVDRKVGYVGHRAQPVFKFSTHAPHHW